MKKFFPRLIIVLTVLASPAAVPAADWSAGLMSNVLWWQPSFRSEYNNFEIDPLLLWGPVVSVTFENKVSVSLLILQNVVNQGSASFERQIAGSLGSGDAVIESKVTRSDLDFTVSYPLSSLIRVFCGYKLFTLDFYPATVTITRGSYTMVNGKKSEDNVGGPQVWGNSGALGASFTIPVSDGTSLNLNTSLLYSYMVTGINLLTESSPGVIKAEGDEFNYQGAGANVTLGISRYIGSMSTAVSVGGRFQYITYFARGDAPELADDYFYGIQISAMYLF